MSDYGFSEAHLALVNTMLLKHQGRGALAGYFLGMASGFCAMNGVEPTEYLFERAIACEDAAEVADVIADWMAMGKSLAARETLRKLKENQRPPDTVTVKEPSPGD